MSNIFVGVGASDDKCHDTYHGDIAFSAPETYNLKKAITALTQTDSGVAAFFSIHCYSQLLLVPWGFDMTILPDDADELVRSLRERLRTHKVCKIYKIMIEFALITEISP